MSLSFHLVFKDECQAAFEFYAKALGGQIGTMLRFKDSPAAATVSGDRLDKIVHANISIEGMELAGSDLGPEQYAAPTGFYLLLGVNSAAKVQSVFNDLAAGGQVTLAPQKTFWSPCYAIVIDRFGVPWKINCGTAQTAT